MRTITFFPCPNGSAPLIQTTVGPGRFPWSYLREELAEYFWVDEDRIATEEIQWVPGQRWSEFVILDGQIIGSIDDRLTDTEWTLVFATRIAHATAA